MLNCVAQTTARWSVCPCTSGSSVCFLESELGDCTKFVFRFPDLVFSSHAPYKRRYSSFFRVVESVVCSGYIQTDIPLFGDPRSWIYINAADKSCNSFPAGNYSCKDMCPLVMNTSQILSPTPPISGSQYFINGQCGQRRDVVTVRPGRAMSIAVSMGNANPGPCCAAVPQLNTKFRDFRKRYSFRNLFRIVSSFKFQVSSLLVHCR